jgi:hypothetical protein
VHDGEACGEKGKKGGVVCLQDEVFWEEHGGMGFGVYEEEGRGKVWRRTTTDCVRRRCEV